MKSINNNFENIQKAVWKVKQDLVKVKPAVDGLQKLMARLEDKSRQCSICLVGLKEREEGSDPMGFMNAHLSK